MIEGVVRAPSLFSTTTGSPPSMTDMQELVVPKSIPKTLAIDETSFLVAGFGRMPAKPYKNHPLPKSIARAKGRNGGFIGVFESDRSGSATGSPVVRRA